MFGVYRPRMSCHFVFQVSVNAQRKRSVFLTVISMSSSARMRAAYETASSDVDIV